MSSERVGGPKGWTCVPVQFSEQVSVPHFQSNPNESFVVFSVDTQIEISRIDAIKEAVLTIRNRDTFEMFTHRRHPTEDFPAHRPVAT